MKSVEQIKYEQELKIYEEKMHIWYAKHLEATNCPNQYSDGQGNPDSIKCHLTGKTCIGCHLQKFTEPEPIAPKYKRFFTPISSYCSNCKNKTTCKDIYPNIEWCLNKVEVS